MFGDCPGGGLGFGLPVADHLPGAGSITGPSGRAGCVAGSVAGQLCRLARLGVRVARVGAKCPAGWRVGMLVPGLGTVGGLAALAGCRDVGGRFDCRAVCRRASDAGWRASGRAGWWLV